MSKLDYGNALLYGLPQSLLQQLQLIQNKAARIITKTRKRDHITPSLIELHWLPVAYRIKYKIALYTYRCLNNMAPLYLKDLVATYQPLRPLRSENKQLLIVPKVRTSYGSRSFAAASATV